LLLFTIPKDPTSTRPAVKRFQAMPRYNERELRHHAVKLTSTSLYETEFVPYICTTQIKPDRNFQQN